MLAPTISIFRRGPDASEWPLRLPGGTAILPLSDQNDMNGQARGVGTVHRMLLLLLRPGERGFAWLVSCELPFLNAIISIAIIPRACDS